MEKYPCILFHHIKTGDKKEHTSWTLFLLIKHNYDIVHLKNERKTNKHHYLSNKEWVLLQWSTCNFVCLYVFPHMHRIDASRRTFHATSHKCISIFDSCIPKRFTGTVSKLGGLLRTNHFISLCHINKCFSLLYLVNLVTSEVVTIVIFRKVVISL